MTLEISGSPIAEAIGEKYVAFCDLLGFSSKVANDFQATLDLYHSFGLMIDGADFGDSVKLTMYSDAILLTSDNLLHLVMACQSVWFFALQHDFMVRGGIAKGKYWEERRGGHLLVVSDALVRAVKLEGAVSIPAIMIADDIDIPEDYWLTLVQDGNFSGPILHFRDRNIVNPFNVMWGTSAGHRAERLMGESPNHRDKYLWFIALYKAVVSGDILVPNGRVQSMLAKGLIGYSQPQPNTLRSVSPMEAIRSSDAEVGRTADD
jgi:hypothetical protein